jgi:methyl-accepting chemotaxis protein
MKKLSTLLFLMFLSFSSLNGGDYCSEVPLSEVIGSANVLNDSVNLSESLLENSEDLLALSESLLDAGSSVNKDYVKAMLQLSQDIGDMADRILEMADKILDMADKIGDMSDRILETQKIQGVNVALTQKNILEAQKNFNTILNK